MRASDGPGNFTLIACPGSGKTRTAVDRVANAKKIRGDSVALCSYTNVGAENLVGTLRRRHAMELGAEDFAGTLHAFLLRYVVYPFAHLRGAEAAPEILESNAWPDVYVGGDRRKPIRSSLFYKTPDGELAIANIPATIQETEAEVLASAGPEALRVKTNYFVRRGLLSPDDSMWIAYQLLKPSTDIAEAVAGRFDEIIIDEAQDTSAMQLACIEAIAKSGELKSLVTIGDFDQSIYGFQGADPERSQSLAKELGLSELRLRDNHRCSQRICEVASAFRRDGSCDAATTDDGSGLSVESNVYDRSNPSAAVDWFSERLSSLGIAESEAVVLTRKNKLRDKLWQPGPIHELKGSPRVLTNLGVAITHGTPTRSDIVRARRMLADVAFGDANWGGSDPGRQAELRNALDELIRLMPPFVGGFKPWFVAARDGVGQAVAALSSPPSKSAGNSIRFKSAHDLLNCEDFVSRPEDGMEIRTVHDIKGEEREAVLILLGKPHHSDPTKHFEMWEAIASDQPLDPALEEERRVAFVGVTRARRFVAVAFPDVQRGTDLAESCVDFGIVPG